MSDSQNMIGDEHREPEPTQTELIAGELCQIVEFPPDCSPKEAAMVADVASRAADELIRLELRLNEATNTVRRLADEGIALADTIDLRDTKILKLRMHRDRLMEQLEAAGERYSEAIRRIAELHDGNGDDPIRLGDDPITSEEQSNLWLRKRIEVLEHALTKITILYKYGTECHKIAQTALAEDYPDDPQSGADHFDLHDGDDWGFLDE